MGERDRERGEVGRTDRQTDRPEGQVWCEKDKTNKGVGEGGRDEGGGGREIKGEVGGRVR